MHQKRRPAAVLSTFILCFAFWLLLTVSLDPKELILGVIFSCFTAWIMSGFFALPDSNAFRWLNPVRWVKMIGYIFVFMGELIKANLAMTKAVFSNDEPRQAVIKVPVNGITNPYGLAILADSITLTPGTITMDVAEQDGQLYMYIQWLNMETEDKDEAGEIIKGRMERWIGSICK